MLAEFCLWASALPASWKCEPGDKSETNLAITAVRALTHS